MLKLYKYEYFDWILSKDSHVTLFIFVCLLVDLFPIRTTITRGSQMKTCSGFEYRMHVHCRVSNDILNKCFKNHIVFVVAPNSCIGYVEFLVTSSIHYEYT